MSNRKTKVFSISFFPEFMKKVDAFAVEEGKTRTELIREALRQYMAKRKREKAQLKRLEQGK